ncbi:MAG TPA: ribose-phosphate diphosphokinase [Rubrivivax sp.]|nr:ribose-phosphate diphosphokinase [Rubrivivax sp.]
MLLFSLDPECRLAPALAAALDETLARHEDRRFEDGEHKLRPLVDPRGDDAYVVCSLHGGPQDSPHDKLCRLLFFMATLREHGAARVTAVVPYLAYARKDRRTQPLDPVTLRYVAQLFEAVGTDQVMVLEAHNVAAFQNAFRCNTLHLEARRAFDALVPELAGAGPLAVASPDPGGVKRALLWREALEARLARPVHFAMVDKRRSLGLVSSGHLVAGDVQGATVLLLDDLIASGETMLSAATALRHAGAKEVVALAAHGLFVGAAAKVLADAHIARVVVTDSVPAFRLPAGGPVADKLRVVSAAPLFAQAIRESHTAWLR